MCLWEVVNYDGNRRFVKDFLEEVFDGFMVMVYSKREVFRGNDDGMVGIGSGSFFSYLDGCLGRFSFGIDKEWFVDKVGIVECFLYNNSVLFVFFRREMGSWNLIKN